MTLHRDLLEELEKNLALLEELSKLDRDMFLADPHHYLLAERCFQLAIQCVLDMGYTLASISGSGLRMDETQSAYSVDRA